METHSSDPIAAPRPTVPESVLRHLLTGQRIVMALVLVGVGLSGCLTTVLSLGTAPAPSGASPVLGSAFMKAGFAYPLLKGLEILLELWISAQRARVSA